MAAKHDRGDVLRKLHAAGLTSEQIRDLGIYKKQTDSRKKAIERRLSADGPMSKNTKKSKPKENIANKADRVIGKPVERAVNSTARNVANFVTGKNKNRESIRREMNRRRRQGSSK